MKKLCIVLSLLMIISISCFKNESDLIENKTGQKVEVKNSPNIKSADDAVKYYNDNGGFILNKQRFSITIGEKSTNEDLQYLTFLTHLTTVSLPSSIDDKGLKYIGILDNLETLGVTSPRIKGDGLKYIKNPQKMVALDMSGTGLTNANVKYIGKMTNLERLLLSKTSITDEGLKYLNGLDKIVDLDLSNNNITDSGLINLQKLKLKGKANFRNTKITDTGLKYFENQSGLTELILEGTKVTAEAATALEKKTQITVILDTSGRK